MEKSIINKMSFYDIVTLVVPSALVYWAYGCPCILCFDNWVGYIALFGVLMVLGLVLKSIGAWWASCGFRNNTDIIKEEEDKQFAQEEQFSFCAVLDTFVCGPLKYIVGPIIKLFIPIKRDKVILKEYYDLYDKAYVDAYYGKRIEILESHVAFLQTLICALVLIMFESKDCIWNLIGICYVCIVIMRYIQRKIYYIIWESRKDNGEEETK